MASIFSKIAAGEIPSYKCAANDEFYAFLDINPMVMGHTLVIPRREVDYIFDLSDDELARMTVGMAVLGLEVPHAHIHLIPMQSEKDMDFRREKLKPTEEEFRAAADAISAAFDEEA